MKHDHIYTLDQWRADGEFLAAPGQEIDQAIYDSMMNAVPPLTLPREAVAQAWDKYNIMIHAGFLNGEEYGTGLYMAFGMNCQRCYYLGLFHHRKGRSKR